MAPTPTKINNGNSSLAMPAWYRMSNGQVDQHAANDHHDHVTQLNAGQAFGEFSNEG
jgi:hypothetical protein